MSAFDVVRREELHTCCHCFAMLSKLVHIGIRLDDPYLSEVTVAILQCVIFFSQITKSTPQLGFAHLIVIRRTPEGLFERRAPWSAL